MESGLPKKLLLEVVTPEGLLLKEEVDEVVAPGELGYFGVRPGHTPFLSTLGMGEITYRTGGEASHLTCFWGFAEVLPDRVNILAELGERAEAIDVARAERARDQAAARMKAIRDESGYADAHDAYVRAVTRLLVAKKRRG
ncbi:MAG TPA: F0F1 ATP synthase subunit epsilon [Vicinamibacteria bacterium]|nr:F0F1 ATP synthase subunit epsilon [Vicinamibacteria bacterium]